MVKNPCSARKEEGSLTPQITFAMTRIDSIDAPGVARA